MLDKINQTIEKYKKAANDIGWDFLRKSPVRDKVFIGHRICGKEQEVYISNLTAHTVKCKHCQLDGYVKAAEKNGWRWIDMCDHTYSRYEHHCGHEQIVSTASMNTQKPVCERCQFEKLSSESKYIGWTFLRKVNKSHGEYMHDACGNIRNIQPSHIRKGHARCEYCFNREKIQSAEVHGFEFVKAVTGHVGTYKHSCGHIANFQFTHMRTGSAKCKHCYESKLANDAVGTEWIWVGRAFDSTSEYLHNCGHTQSIRHDKFSNGGVGAVCKSCQNNWYDKASNIYIVLFNSEKGRALKVGFAKSHEHRKYTFKMLDGIDCDVIFSVPVRSGRDAILKEKDIHKKLKHLRLPPDVGRLYVSSGFTEMYPIEKIDEIQSFVIAQCTDLV